MRYIAAKVLCELNPLPVTDATSSRIRADSSDRIFVLISSIRSASWGRSK